MKKALSIALSLSLAVGVYITAKNKDKALTEKPPEQANSITLEPSISRAAVAISFPYDVLTSKAREHTPSSFKDKGNGKDVCGKIDLLVGKTKVCAGTKYSYKVDVAPPTISKGSGSNTIRISTKIVAKGKGGFRGDGAKLLGLDKKNFRAAANAFVDLSFSVDKNWCPVVSVKADYSWTDRPKVEVVSKAWVDLSGLVKNKLDDQLKAMGREAAKAISCDDLKKEVVKIWRTQSFPVDIPNAPSQLFVNVTPSEAGFSGLVTDDKSAHIGLSIKSSIEVSDKAIKESTLPLPELKAISAQSSDISLAIPFTVELSELSTILTAVMSDQHFKADTPAGEAVITADKVDIVVV